MHAPRDQRLGLVEIARLAGQAMRVEQRVDRVAGAAAGAVKVRRSRVTLARPVSRRSIQRKRDLRPSSMSMHPVGELDHGGARSLRAGQEVMQHQAGGVVVLRARPAARRSAALRVGAVRGGAGGLVVLGVPEVAAVVGGAVAGGVVEVDVGDVAGEVVGERPPPVIAGLHEAGDEAGDRVVLVVVVRHQSRPRGPHRDRQSCASRIHR